MTDDQAKGRGSRPRTGAGEPARTQQIPRMKREDGGQGNGSQRRPGPAPAGPAAAKGQPAKNGQPASKQQPGQKPAQKSALSGAATGDRAATREQARKLVDADKKQQAPSAADYARSTRGSASSTAVIPAVKDGQGAKNAKGRDGDADTRGAGSSPASSGGRQASLRLTRIEPWSVTRLAFVVSVLLMVVSVVAVTIFWVVLDLTGVWDQLNGSITNVLSDNEGSFDLTDYLGLGRLVGLTLVLSAINVVLMTALATIAAHLYNLAAQLLGGVHVTFTDD